MSDFDEFERQLNENKQGEGAGVVGWLLASPCAPPLPFLLFPSLGPHDLPPPVPRAPSSRDLPLALREGVAGEAHGACAPQYPAPTWSRWRRRVLSSRRIEGAPHSSLCIFFVVVLKFCLLLEKDMNLGLNSFSFAAFALPLPVGRTFPFSTPPLFPKWRW